MDAINVSRRIILVCLALLVCASCAPPPNKKLRYQITDLGTLGGDSFATAVNNNQQVAGYCLSGQGGPRAFLQSHGLMREIKGPGGESCAPFAVNDSALVAGYYNESSGARRAFSWYQGVSTGLGSFGYESVAYGVNNAGKIVGEVFWKGSGGYTPWRSAFVYENGTMASVDNYWGPNEAALDVNNAGVIVGAWEFNAWVQPQLYRYIAVFAPEHYLFPNDNGAFHVGTAMSVNEAGQLTGWTSTYHFTDVRAFVASGHTFTELGTLGGEFSYGSCINAGGQIVGVSTVPDGSMHAFVYKDGQMKDLNSLLTGGMPFTVLTAASGINDNGYIVGWGQLKSGGVHAFIAKPVMITAP